jgi:hypothetical protein
VIDNWISWIHEIRGQYDLAEKSNLKVLGAGGVPPAQLARYRAAYRRGGWKAYWRAQLEDRPRPYFFRENADSNCVGYYVGLADLYMGAKDAAFDGLSRAVAQRCVWTMWLKVDPRLDPLRNDPRFAALLRRINLPASGVVPVADQ